MNTPSVSIVIAVYNAEPYLHRCMDSLLNQTLQNIEILLINDGSTDNSGALCDEYAAKDPRVKVFHRTNHGVGATRQFGLEHVTGEYVIHADPDDWLDLDMLEKMYETAEKENADMVICDYIMEYGNRTRRLLQKPSSTASEQVLVELFSFIHGGCCNKLVRVSTIQQYEIDFVAAITSYGEDKLFNMRLLQHPIRIAYCPNIAYHYDQIVNSASLVRTETPSMTLKRVHYIQKLREYQTTESITTGISIAECSVAFMAIKTQTYPPEDFYQTFSKLQETSILRLPTIPFHIRFIVWTAFHINYRTAERLMAFKLWYRKRIKGLNE